MPDDVTMQRRLPLAWSMAISRKQPDVVGWYNTKIVRDRLVIWSVIWLFVSGHTQVFSSVIIVDD